MNVVVLRLKRGDDLKSAIFSAVLTEKTKSNRALASGCVVSCVGCLSHVALRLADATKTLQIAAPFEVLTLNGTLTSEHVHLHLSAADAEGRVIGGHLLEGNIVSHTMEVFLHFYPEMALTREWEPDTGYSELVIH